MSTSKPPSTPDDTARLQDLDTEAVTWVVRLTSGETDERERAAFEAWRAQSPAHEAAVARARQLWLGLGDVLPEPSLPRAKRHRLVSALALAASLLLAVGLGYQYLTVWRHDYVTAMGRRDLVMLADGSRVQLSSGSAIDTRYEAGMRRVRLIRGEAYFDVVHDAARPFVVDAGNGEVRDLGTAFSVRVDGDDILVVVERGQVEISSGPLPVKLVPNQRVRYSKAKVGRIEPANMLSDLAWTRGRLVLEDQPLGSVVDELNRQYASKVVLLGGEVGSRRVNAVIDLEHIDDWLNALHESQGVTVMRLPGVVLLF